MTNWQRLLGLLHGIGFHASYRALCLAYPAVGQPWKMRVSPATRAALKCALADTGLAFQFFRSEDFYRYHLTEDARCDIKLHVSTIGAGALELALYVQFGEGDVLGGHFATLSRAVSQQCEPGEQAAAALTQLFFNGDEERLQGAVRGGTELFVRARDAILAETGWRV